VSRIFDSIWLCSASFQLLCSIHEAGADCFIPATWLKRKFVAEAQRRVDTKAALHEVLDKPNPFSTTGQNFTKRFSRRNGKNNKNSRKQILRSKKKIRISWLNFISKRAHLRP
jgi:hypothetical protein